MHHLFARKAGDGVIFAQINRLFRANLLAHAAKNAADHVDIEFLRILLDLAKPIGRWNLARRDLDGAWRTNEFAKLARDATHSAVLIADERGRAAIIFRHAVVQFLLWLFIRSLR